MGPKINILSGTESTANCYIYKPSQTVSHITVTKQSYF